MSYSIYLAQDMIKTYTLQQGDSLLNAKGLFKTYGLLNAYGLETIPNIFIRPTSAALAARTPLRYFCLAFIKKRLLCNLHKHKRKKRLKMVFTP